MVFFKKNLDKIITGIAFGIFLLVTCYGLTASSLWYDEAIEYWYSKIMFGELPMTGVADGTTNMYQRIIITFQPPLYNIIMFFWLKISDGELWFRFFGVLMGFVGMIGLYKTIKKMANSYIAATAVICSSTIYTLYSYWQECAEYCLVLASLFWTIYFWICLLQEINLRHIITFTIFCIISVYSQYGAIFPVFAMILSAYLYILSKKQRKDIVQISLTYLIALVFAAIPLYVFFIKKQMLKRQADGFAAITIPHFDEGILHDFYDGLLTTFRWNFFSYIYSDAKVQYTLIVILILGLISLILGKNKLIKIIIFTNIICWICYYIAVKFGIYSGAFGVRHNLFFTPMWIVLICAVLVDIFSMLAALSLPHIHPNILKALKWGFFTVCMAAVCYFTIFNWTGKLIEHSYKSDVRGPVNEWYTQKAYEKPTIVYYAADPGFAYYVRQNENYNEHTEDHVTYMDWLQNLSVDEYSSLVDSFYGQSWPQDVYIVAANFIDDLDVLAECFTQKGYTREDLYDIHYGKLIYLSKNGSDK